MDKPTIFVFDNFETTTDPIDLFNLINTHIRLPNKVIITTRHRDFKGDYPVTVQGMEESEATLLINDYSAKLGIADIVTDQYKYNLYKESDGHPYIIKVLLGEAKQSGSARKVERVVASKNDMLDALFERTYSRLSASAKKTFLTLSNRRYIIPKVALEAVMLRPGNDLYDVEEALLELENCSFIEVLYSKEDSVEYISVPLTASVFGKKKLAVSAYKPHVEIDTKYFDLFGPTQRVDLSSSFDSRIHNLVRRIKERIKRGNNINDFIHILKYIASQHTRTWLIIADLFAEQNIEIDEAKNAIRQFIQNSNQEDAYSGWQKLEELCWRTADYNCQVQCLYEICNLEDVEYRVLSDAANTLNKLLHEQKIDYKTEEKRLIIGSLTVKLEMRISEANGDDCSRLAWLYLNIQNPTKARELCSIGLTKDEDNLHCMKLFERLNGR